LDRVCPGNSNRLSTVNGCAAHSITAVNITAIKRVTPKRVTTTQGSSFRLSIECIYTGVLCDCTLLSRFSGLAVKSSNMSPTKSTFAHSRQNSQESEGTGSSYQLILEHILSYPQTYEIPLRDAYTLNARMHSPSTHASRTASPTNSSPTSPQFPSDQQSTTAKFTTALMEQISQLPSHPSSLPPSFVTSFLNRCFPVDLEFVDFPQSLTALDYLKDLDNRRRKEITHSLRTLNIDETNFSPKMVQDLRSSNPTVADWVEGLGAKLKRAESLYNNVYISLRRWILINEMCLQPFNKNNCLAMLNTLYPPVMSSQPTTKLTLPVLQAQREGYFRYIQTVEKRGTACLETLMKQGRKEDEMNGWPAVRRALSQYLSLVNSIINECWDVKNLRFNTTRPLEPAAPPPSPPVMDQDTERRQGRKVDSGVSFGAQGQHSKNNSTSSNKSTASSYRPSHGLGQADIGKGGTALERLAREFRKIRPKQKSVNEIEIPRRPSLNAMDQENHLPDSPSVTPKPKGISRLRKMKSLGALSEANSSMTSLMGLSRSASPTFDAKEMKRERAAYDARMMETSFQ